MAPWFPPCPSRAAAAGDCLSTTPAYEPPHLRSRAAGRLAVGLRPPAASSATDEKSHPRRPSLSATVATDEKSHPRRPSLSATDKFLMRAAPEPAVTRGVPCWPRPRTRAAPGPAEDVALWPAPQGGWSKS